MALKKALSIGAGIVIIQDSFIGNQEIYHSKFNFYLSLREKKKIRIMIVVRKDLADNIMVDYWTDLIYHPYF